MNEPAHASIALAFGAISTLLVTDGAAAQTCTNPQKVMVGSKVTGNTCGANAFPTMNHGTIDTPGDDLVFKAYGRYGVDALFLKGPPGEVFVFVCSGCGVNAECIASGATDSNGMAFVEYPKTDGDYYVIIDSPTTGCLDYSLRVSGPLRANP